MDYDLWCGPAPQDAASNAASSRPLRLALDLGLRQRRPRQPGHPRDGQGPLGPGQDDDAERRSFSLGGRFGYIDDGETANTQLCVFDYGDAKLIFEVRGLHRPTRLQGRRSVGNIWFGTDGYVVCPSYTGGVAYDKDGKEVAEVHRRRRPAPLRQLRQGRPQPARSRT